MDPIHALLIIGLTWAITNGVKAIATQTGHEFQGSVSAVVAAVVAILLTWVDPLLAQIPGQWAGIANQIANLLIIILSGYGVHYEVKLHRPVAAQ